MNAHKQIADFDEKDVGESGGVGDLSVEGDAPEPELSGKRHTYVAHPCPSLPARHERPIVHILHCLV